MIRQPPSSTPTYPLFPYPTLFRSPQFEQAKQEDLIAMLESAVPWLQIPFLQTFDHETDLNLRRSRRPASGGVDGVVSKGGVLADSRTLAEPGYRVGRSGVGRSEEHTSELQSLMRISYAVFCLKKQTKMHTTQE